MKKIIIVFVFIILSAIILTSLFLWIPTTPEYSLYKTANSIKTHNYIEARNYVNIKQISDNLYNQALSQIPDSSQNNYFVQSLMQGFSSMLETSMENGFKELVLSKNNIFTDIDNIKLIYFLVIKNYNGLNITIEEKDVTTRIVKLKNTENNYYEQLMLSNSKNAYIWEIIAISSNIANMIRN